MAVTESKLFLLSLQLGNSVTRFLRNFDTLAKFKKFWVKFSSYFGINSMLLGKISLL